MLDIEQLLKPKQPDRPCGEDPEYDQLYSEMEDAKEGSSGHNIVGANIDAVGSDWQRVKKLTLQILDYSLDLRVATNLCMACLHTHGFPGFKDGLELLCLLLDKHWGCLHPALDLDDSEPAFMRANALSELTSHEFLLAISKYPIISSSVHGQVSLADIRDVQPLKDSTDREQRQKYQYLEGVLQEAFSSDDGTLTSTIEHLKRCHTKVGTLNTIFAESAGGNQGVDLQPLTNLLVRSEKLLASKLPSQAYDEGQPEQEDESSPTPAPRPTTSSSPYTGNDEDMNIHNRDNVIEAIDKICGYYDINEPSSPVPLLLRRARNMVDKNFFEILQDISPDNTAQAENLFGLKDEEDK